MNPEIKEAINQYIVQLSRTKATSHKVIRRTNTSELRDVTRELNKLEQVTIPQILLDYLSIIGGYDDSKCELYSLHEPEFIWGMNPIESDYIAGHYNTQAETADETKWPKGFVPFLENGTGNYVVINCIKESPTYGGIYDMTEGVGINRVAKDLIEFLNAAGKELNKGIRIFEGKDYSVIRDMNRFFKQSKELFGDSPYFNREGKMDTQIIDWK